MTYKNLTVSIEDGIAVLTINRPDKLNALNRQTVTEIGSAHEALLADKSVKAIIITGAGEKAFVAGADIAEIQALDGTTGFEFATDGQDVFEGLELSEKPVIAAVNGFALGGGCELAMACHLRIASEQARFGQPEVNLGLIPGFGGTQRLPRLVGKGRALQLLMTGEMIDAQEALRIGLVNAVVAQDQLIAYCRKLLATILQKSPLAVAKVIDAVNEGLDMDMPDAQGYEAQLFGEVCGSKDKAEGTSAFLEKRHPKFSGE